jgi:hypothetical protein
MNPDAPAPLPTPTTPATPATGRTRDVTQGAQPLRRLLDVLSTTRAGKHAALPGSYLYGTLCGAPVALDSDGIPRWPHRTDSTCRRCMQIVLGHR